MRGGWKVGFLLAAVTALGGAVAIVWAMARDDGARPQDAGPPPPETPVEVVTAYYDAVRDGDCETVDALQTDLLLDLGAMPGGRSCRDIAEQVAENPERWEPIIPRVTDLQVDFESDEVVVVVVTFYVPSEAHTTTRNTHLLRQPSGDWILGTPAEAILADPEVFAYANRDADEDLIVFLDRAVTDDQRAALEATMSQNADIATFDYMDEAASVEDAQERFEGSTEMLEEIEQRPDVVPTSYRLTLVETDQATAADVAARLEGLAGVMRVESTRFPIL
ncbi:MAG: permease-like cell division protein FtsX [Acidimicrobiales bacterium]